MGTGSGLERRAHRRGPACFAVTIDGALRANRFGIVRDASAGGVRINSPSRFADGDAVTLTLHLPPSDVVRVAGRVVRVERAPAELPWQYVLAVRFDAPRPEVAPQTSP